MGCRNGIMNQRFGPHPNLFDFVQHLADWFCEGFAEHDQHLKHGFVNKRTKKKILKDKALNRWWTFIDSKQQNEDILLFLENALKALKADVKNFTDDVKMGMTTIVSCCTVI